jgi:hypothetical protein
MPWLTINPILERLYLQKAGFGNGPFTPGLKPAPEPVGFDRQLIGLFGFPTVDVEVEALQCGSIIRYDQPFSRDVNPSPLRHS